jgi:acyl dehydratase
MLYALGVGAGGDDSTTEIEFTTENSHNVDQRVLPTYGVLLAPGGPIEALGDIDRAQLLHAGQSFQITRPLPAEGCVIVTTRVRNIFDKGKAALVERESVSVDATTGEELIRSVGSLFLRGEGGFGGDPGPTIAWERPARQPDEIVTLHTKPNQALIYRLSGDRNPLHSDPWFARRGGFDRPILHGLCTFGFAGRALVRAACGGNSDLLRSMGGRFVRPIHPGDDLVVSIWMGPDMAQGQFQVSLPDDGMVFDFGTFTTAAE